MGLVSQSACADGRKRVNLETVPLDLFPEIQTGHALMTCCRCLKHVGSFRINEEFSFLFLQWKDGIVECSSGKRGRIVENN